MDVNKRRIILIDLDGVCIMEAEPPIVIEKEILLLHRSLLEYLINYSEDVFILTHRSRREAKKIIRSFNFECEGRIKIFAAEDLLISALKHRQFSTLVKKGLRKSLILKEIESRYYVARSNIFLIDDRMDNAEDMLNSGIGLVMHAPFSIDYASHVLTTFDLNDVKVGIAQWVLGKNHTKIFHLRQVKVKISDITRSGMNTSKDMHHSFNFVRTKIRRIRTFLSN